MGLAKICMYHHTRDAVVQSVFHQNLFMDFRDTRGRNLIILITLTIGFTTACTTLLLYTSDDITVQH